MRTRDPTTQLRLISVDPGWDGQVTAQYNPKELQIDKTAAWSGSPGLNGNVAAFQFQGSEGRTVSMELFLDAYEAGQTVHDDLGSLTAMMLVKDPASRDESQRRPPLLRMVNGPLHGFVCVLESLSIKVVMFDSQYRAARAVVSVKLKEVDRSEVRGRGPQAQYRDERRAQGPRRAR